MKKKGFLKGYFTLIFIIACAVVAGSAAGAFIALSRDLPQIRELENFKPSAVTRIYSRDNVVIAELYAEHRDPVPLEMMPDNLKTALLTMEDRSFYNHHGVDLRGIGRAIVADIKARKFVQGASTITQQLAKTLFLTPRKTIVRKLREALLAFQLERRYTKDEILQFYLNQVYFGSGAYGVESAAGKFFGKSVKDLTLAECALVAAMPRSPSRYSPLVNPDLAIKRRNIVLRQMMRTNKITKEECDKAVKEELSLNKSGGNAVRAPYFVAYVKDYLEETLKDRLGPSMLYKGGLRIYTTLSHEFQEYAEQAVSGGMEKLRKRMKQRGIKDDPQAALVCIDVPTGGILAMVGGVDFKKSSFNRAVSAKRQPGSAFKPLVYALAVEQGFPQNRMILDAPVVFKGGKGRKDWRPENFSGSYKGEITLRKALALSKNIPAVRLIEMLGPSSAVKFAHSLGIKSDLSPNLSLSLGTSEVSLLELASSYAVFPNRGKRIEPFGVTEIRDGNGRLLWRAKPAKSAAMSRSGAAIMANMLEAVVSEGTGKKARVIKKQLAGKTGTTNSYKDALFVGFSPTLSTGVWVGRDNSKSLGRGETGARAALPVWIDFMSKALEKRKYEYFDIPDDTVRLSMDPSTGLLATGSEGAVPALFKKGTEPAGHK